MGVSSFLRRQKRKLSNWASDVASDPLGEAWDFMTGQTAMEAMGINDAPIISDVAKAGKQLQKGDLGGAVGTVTDGLGITDYEGQAQKQADAEQALTDMQGNADSTYSAIIQALGGTDAVKSYVDAINGANEKIDATDLSYNKTVDQFMDPAAEYTINQSVKAAQNALAGQGGMSGGAAAQQLQAVASEAASSEYNSAWDRMVADQTNDLALKKANIEKEQTKVSNLGELSDQTLNALLTQLATDTNFQMALAQMKLDSSSSNPLADFLNVVTKGSEAYSNFNS